MNLKGYNYKVLLLNITWKYVLSQKYVPTAWFMNVLNINIYGMLKN